MEHLPNPVMGWSPPCEWPAPAPAWPVPALDKWPQVSAESAPSMESMAVKVAIIMGLLWIIIVYYGLLWLIMDYYSAVFRCTTLVDCVDLEA